MVKLTSRAVNETVLYWVAVAAVLLFVLKTTELVIDPVIKPLGVAVYYVAAGLSAFYIVTLVWRLWTTQDTPVETANPQAGIVYLLSIGSGLYKIGHTNSPRVRMNAIRTASPFDPVLVCAIRSEDRFALEKMLHQRFAAKRYKREWFRLSDTDIAYIRGLSIVKYLATCPDCGWEESYETTRGATNGLNAHARFCPANIDAKKG